ncbi:MAG: protein kinase [Planctomycetota bacterium]
MASPQDVSRAFELVCDLHPDERSAALDRLDLDEAGRAEVERLLAFYDLPSSELDDLRPEQLGAALGAGPRRYGPYELERPLGEGGMGIVYLAHHAETGEEVAVKVLRGGLHSAPLRRRFRRECEVLEVLRHPGICRFIEAGEGGDPLAPEPYLAMEYVPGATLLHHAKEARLGPRERIELIARVCDAVQHAHEAGVVHRDLKPNNVLALPGRDGDRVGTPKVLDFGVARALVDELTTDMRTQSGAMIGTVAYMSPEQVAGRRDEVAARSDVYSLGVILYELLAGRLPHPVTGLPVPMAARIIQEEEPTRLGSVVAELSGSLDLVLGKALEKDPRRRYASAAALAGDLRRYLAGEPVTARPPTLWRQGTRFVRRHAVLSAAVAATVVALAIGLVSTLSFALSEVAAREEASRNLYRTQLEAAAIAIRDGNARAALSRLERAPVELRGWEWSHLLGRTDDSDLSLQLGKSPSWLMMSFNRSGRGLLTVSCLDRPDEPSTIEYAAYGVPSGEVLAAGSFPGVPGARLTPDWLLPVLRPGRALALYLLPEGAGIRLPLDLDGTERQLAVNGTLALASSSTGSYRIDLQTGDVERLPHPPGGNERRIRQDVGLGTTPTVRGGLYLFDLEDPSRHVELSDGEHGVYSATFRPDGAQLAQPTSQGKVTLWRVTASGSAEVEARIGSHRDAARIVAYSADSRLIATGGESCAVHVTRLAGYDRVRSFSGHRSEIVGLAFSPDGRWIASASSDGNLRLFDLQAEDPRTLRGGSYLYAAGFDASGEVLVVGTTDGELLLHDSLSLVPYARVPLWEGESIVQDLAFDREHGRVAACSRRGQLVIVELESGDTVGRIEHEGVLSASFAPDGSTLAVASPERLSIYDARTFELLRAAPIEGCPEPYVRHSPDGRWIAFASGNAGPMAVDRTCVTLLDARSFGVRAELRGHTDRVRSLAFSPDGDRLATASFDSTVRVWSVPDGSEVTPPLASHVGQVCAVAWSRDGKRLFSGSFDLAIKVWDAEHWVELATLLGHEDYVFNLASHPHTDVLVSAGGDGTARIWGTRRRDELVEEAQDYRAAVERLAPAIVRLAERPHSEATAELTGLSKRERRIALQQLVGRRRGRP